ncbi:MAG TPA: hypothetical protein VGD67_14135, partial [Pseudonocardiaceae bacterium]
MRNNTTENVFRFLQLRPVLPAGPDPEGGGGPVDVAGTGFVHRLTAAAPADRAELARRFLEQDARADEVLASPRTRHLLAAARQVLRRRGTTQDLLDAVAREPVEPGEPVEADETAKAVEPGQAGRPGEAVAGEARGSAATRWYRDARDALSDTLLARRVLGATRELVRIERLFRLCALVADVGRRPSTGLRRYLYVPIRLPEALRPAITPPATGLRPRTARERSEAEDREATRPAPEPPASRPP